MLNRFINELEKTPTPVGNPNKTGLGPDGTGVLTISGGLASYPRDGFTVQELFEQADKALVGSETQRQEQNISRRQTCKPIKHRFLHVICLRFMMHQPQAEKPVLKFFIKSFCLICILIKVYYILNRGNFHLTLIRFGEGEKCERLSE